MTEPEPLQQVDRTYVRWRNRKLIYFSGCDYFRLSSHPAVLKAAEEGICIFGLNVAASRLTTGNHRIYRALETELAKFFGVEDALLVSSGYASNPTVAQALAGNFSHVLLDERAHPSLVDAANLLDCPVLKFKHRDPAIVAQTIARCGAGSRPIVLTDGMFAHDGSVAPLRAYLNLVPRDGMILVDDAHGAGVLGKTGRGSLEQEQVGRERIIQCITLSKAFGAYGGAVLTSAAMRTQILTRSRMFVGSTPLPLPMANAALRAVKILQTHKNLRRHLFDNVSFVRTNLRGRGLEIPEIPGPIIPLINQTRSEIVALKRRFLAEGIFPPFLNYPGGPEHGYFRIVISSEHSSGQLTRLVEAIQPDS